MLKVIQVSSPAAKKNYLNQIDISKESWIVSDLQSREEVQIALGQKYGRYEAHSVLRASELWAELLKRQFPHYRLVGNHLSRMMIGQFLEEYQQFSSPRATATLLSYMSQLMPILSHDQGPELISDWFEGQQESSMRWRSWFELSFHAWQYFDQHRSISHNWASAFLANHWMAKGLWNRSLYFDLGLEIHQVEAELISHLSQECDVYVFEPVKDKKLEKDHSDRVYDLIREKADEVIECEAFCPDGMGREYLRMATPLAEVKDSLSRCRALLDQGVPAQKIAIVAPRLESYWFCLRSYLEKEGIPVRRSSSERYASLLSIQQWLSELRVRLGNLDAADLEMSYYAGAQSPVSYESFRALFTSVYDADHFDRDEEVKKYFEQDKWPELLKRDEFISIAIRHWPRQAPFQAGRFLLQLLVQECGGERQFSSRQWVEYLSALAAEKELRTHQADKSGIYCGDIRSVEHVDASHIFFLGLTSNGLNQGGDQQVLAGDVERIAQDIGFYINHPEQDHIEGLIRWLCQCSESVQTYMFPMTDFKGAEMSPSKFWIKGAIRANPDSYEEVTNPGLSRWDEIRQVGTLPDAVGEAVEWDLGIKDRPSFGGGKVLSLSASSVESYLRCPFIFAAQKLFRLADEPIADVDFEARGKGLLIHLLFEKLMEPPLNFNRSESELRELIDRLAEESKLSKVEARFWPALKERLVQLAIRFLAKEKERKQQFPSTSTVGRELDFVFYFNPATQEISLEPKESFYRFKGQIDRLDTDAEGAGVIYDYKTSKSSKMTHADRWLEKEQIQLAIYCIAVEAGATGAGPQRVIGAFYYIVKDLNDSTGFRVTEEAGRLFDLKDGRRNRISNEQKLHILEGIKQLLAQAVQNMEAGQFAPQPKDTQICETCPWSRTCRAPHLH